MKKLKMMLVAMPILALMFVLLAGAIQPEWKLVVKLFGTVESQKQNSADWIMINQARELKDGDKARTLADSRAKIQLADQSVVTLGSNTSVEIAQFQLKENKRIVELKMTLGRIRADVSKFFKGESSFEVKTKKAVLAARGTDFYVDVQEVGDAPQKPDSTSAAGLVASLGPLISDGETAQAPGNAGENVYLAVYEGSVQATVGNNTQTFYTGQTGLITPQGNIIFNPPQPPPPITGGQGFSHDQDMRNEGPGGGPGAPGGTQGAMQPPPPPGPPEDQGHIGAPGGGPGGSAPPPPPVGGPPSGGIIQPPPLLTPSEGTGVNIIENVINNNTGTLHINIR
ncbi:MAG: FecR family protein [Candidatus Eremiobacteraeota bacterium]|nr:FecR family protein [Candidatus Eremiobacteraeota bacterium]